MLDFIIFILFFILFFFIAAWLHLCNRSAETMHDAESLERGKRAACIVVDIINRPFKPLQFSAMELLPLTMIIHTASKQEERKVFRGDAGQVKRPNANAMQDRTLTRS